MSALRLVFFGTAALACPSLAALACEPAWSLLGVVTQPDRPKGRALRLRPSPVKELAQRLGLPVWQPERARHETFVQTLRELAPDLIVVAAYGQILPAAILDLPRYGCLNVHASLLPKYRGAAPIQWALLNDDATTGVTIMKMDPGLDTGGMLLQDMIPITATDDAESLHDRLAKLGAALLVRAIPQFVGGRLPAQAQPAECPFYARKITKEDGRLDWALPARTLSLRVRAFTPWPGAFTFLAGGEKPMLLKIWRAEVSPSPAGPPGAVLQADKAGVVVGCGQEALRILELQREGGRRLKAGEFLAGHPLPVGELLGG